MPPTAPNKIDLRFSRCHGQAKQLLTDAERIGIFDARRMGAAPRHLALLAAQPGNLAGSNRARQGGMGSNDRGVVTAREGLSSGQ